MLAVTHDEFVNAACGAPTMTYRSLFCLFLAAAGADAANSTLAGKFVVEHPTLLNLGFEWEIRGDANRNATVTVQFRAVGEPGWREALPLVRIGGENVYRRRENLDYTVPDGFAGSILNLKPGTEYECRFQLTDPDATRFFMTVGEAVQLVIGGLTEDSTDAPGPFGNYLLASTHDMNWSTKSGGAGPIIETQDWVFAAASGEDTPAGNIGTFRSIRSPPRTTRIYRFGSSPIPSLALRTAPPPDISRSKYRGRNSRSRSAKRCSPLASARAM
jgi:hypothetical protein